VDEKRLWAAVLIQAVKDLAGFSTDNEAERGWLQASARAWFASERYSEGSFLWVCQQLEFEPSWIRRMIAGMKADALAEYRLNLRVSRAHALLIASDDHTIDVVDDALMM